MARRWAAPGFKIWRYRLVAEPPQNPVTNPPPEPPPGAGADGLYSVSSASSATRRSPNGSRTYTRRRVRSAARRLHTAAGAYAEGAHLRPVGSPYHGPDAVENVLCLCPNDHVLLDRGAIVLDDRWNVVDRARGKIIGPLRRKSAHTLDAAHAAYQRALFSVAGP